MMINGLSTGCLPIHVNASRSATISQNKHWMRSQNIMLCGLDVRGIVTIARIRIETIRANMPPNLVEMDHKIAYAKRKYHSGLMCGGVLRGLAVCNCLALLEE